MGRLGSSDWYTREAADWRLRFLMPLSAPAVSGALSSDDPEVRFRAAGIMGRWWSFQADYRAACTLACPFELSAVRLYADDELRRRIYRLACRKGHTEAAYWLLPEHESGHGIGWFGNWMPIVRVANSYREVRLSLGYGLDWVHFP